MSNAPRVHVVCRVTAVKPEQSACSLLAIASLMRSIIDLNRNGIIGELVFVHDDRVSQRLLHVMHRYGDVISAAAGTSDSDCYHTALAAALQRPWAPDDLVVMTSSAYLLSARSLRLAQEALRQLDDIDYVVLDSSQINDACTASGTTHRTIQSALLACLSDDVAWHETSVLGMLFATRVFTLRQDVAVLAHLGTPAMAGAANAALQGSLSWRQLALSRLRMLWQRRETGEQIPHNWRLCLSRFRNPARHRRVAACNPPQQYPATGAIHDQHDSVMVSDIRSWALHHGILTFPQQRQGLFLVK